jgi:hypothetical protein
MARVEEVVRFELEGFDAVRWDIFLLVACCSWSWGSMYLVSSGGICVVLRRLDRCFNILLATSTSRMPARADEVFKMGSSVALLSSWVLIG